MPFTIDNDKTPKMETPASNGGTNISGPQKDEQKKQSREGVHATDDEVVTRKSVPQQPLPRRPYYTRPSLPAANGSPAPKLPVKRPLEGAQHDGLLVPYEKPMRGSQSPKRVRVAKNESSGLPATPRIKSEDGVSPSISKSQAQRRTASRSHHPPAEAMNVWVLNLQTTAVEINKRDAVLGIVYPIELTERLVAAENSALANVNDRGLKRKNQELSKYAFPIYLVKLEKNTESPFREVKETFFDLKKANAYAMFHFRAWVARRFPVLPTTPHEQEFSTGKPRIEQRTWSQQCGSAWVMEEWSIRNLGRLGWFINGDGGVVLSAHMPSTNKQMTVRVEAHSISQ
ncbi:hypothetical protein SCUP234_04223 [Seiridium cupressi]